MQSMARKIRRAASLLALAFLALLLGLHTAAAQEDFYRGKLVTLLIGDPPGGAADAYARLLAGTFGRFLPGNPTIIVQTMPGASSIIAANYLHKSAPKDGTTLLMPQAAAIMAPLFGNQAAAYKPSDFVWIGNFDQATGTCSVWQGAGIASFEDLLTHPAMLGAVAPSGVASEYPRSMNALFGTRIRVIHGYEGTGQLVLSIHNGEIQGACAFMLSALKGPFRNDYDSGKLFPIIQFARKSEELKGVPHILDFAKSEEDRKLFNLVYNRDTLGRGVVVPLGVPPERVALLRAAFDASVKDPALRETAERAGLPLNSMTGAEAEAFARDLANVSPAIVARAQAALDFGKNENEQLKSLAGTLTAAAKDRIALTDEAGKPHGLKLTEAVSMVMIAGKPGDSTELQPGMGCTVRYAEPDLVQMLACK
jgi:tripartite-type tricarboxylate transporter receptor subunit TctC